MSPSVKYEWEEGDGPPAPGFKYNGSQTITRVHIGQDCVTTGTVNVRRQPSLDSTAVTVLPANVRVTVYEERGYWGRSDLGWTWMARLKKLLFR